MRISDWSSDVCSSDLADAFARIDPQPLDLEPFLRAGIDERHAIEPDLALQAFGPEVGGFRGMILRQPENAVELDQRRARIAPLDDEIGELRDQRADRKSVG